MNKLIVKNISFVILAVVLIVSMGIVGLITGTRADNLYYVCLESVPRVEFITDNHGIVKTVKPLNIQGKYVVYDKQYVGKHMTDVASDFVTTSEKLGYIDVNGDNVLKVSVIAGLTQSFENKLVSTLYKKFVSDNVKCVIIESANDLVNFKSAKANGVSYEKYDLMLALAENTNTSPNSYIKLSSKKIIDAIYNCHVAYEYNYTTQDVQNINELISGSVQKYDDHITAITDSSTRQFKTKYVEYLATNTHKYNVDFEREKDNLYNI